VGGDEIAAGDRVRHTHWGDGVVVEVVGRGDAAEATVEFRGIGEKRLLLAWAPLEKV
jgi:DNA helicase-2/ATP-dependent DNA helicase PcrA